MKSSKALAQQILETRNTGKSVRADLKTDKLVFARITSGIAGDARISHPTVSTTSYSRWAISSDRVFAPYAPISTQWVTPDSSIRYS